MSETTLTPAAAFAFPAPSVGINPWFMAITVTLATFMELLDTAIANVALPHIAGVQLLDRQAAYLAFLDCFTALGSFVLLGAPLVFLIRRFTPPGSSSGD